MAILEFVFSHTASGHGLKVCLHRRLVLSVDATTVSDEFADIFIVTSENPFEVTRERRRLKTGYQMFTQ